MYKKIYSALLAGKLEVTPVKKPEPESNSVSQSQPSPTSSYASNAQPSVMAARTPEMALESMSDVRQTEQYGYHSEPPFEPMTGYSPEPQLEPQFDPRYGFSQEPHMEQNSRITPEYAPEYTPEFKSEFNPEYQTHLRTESQHDNHFDLDTFDEIDNLTDIEHPDIFNPFRNSGESQAHFDSSYSPTEHENINRQWTERDHEMINVFDEKGEPLGITRYDWRTSHLPRQLQENWQHPEQLVSVVMQALQDEFIAEIDEATQWLMQCDANQERAYCLRSIVLMRLDKVAEAEQLLLSYLAKYPKTGYILTNLAKTQDAQGNRVLALQTLEEGLVLDSNQENALDWWLSLYQEDAQGAGFEADQAYYAALAEAGQRFPGWRINLKLGSYFADQKQKEAALYYFNEVIKDQYYFDTLSIIAGDLGKNGFVAEMIDLIAPHYLPEQHDVYAGLNLLSAYLSLQRIEEGETLLQKMFQLHNPTTQQHLLMFQQEFANLRGAPQQVEDSFSMQSILINEPVWLEKLGDLGKRFKLQKSGKKIALIQFAADIAAPHTTASISRPSLEGCLSRAIPCYLLESLYLGSSMDSAVVIPVANDHSYALYSNPISHDEILTLQAQGGYSGVLSGHIVGEQLTLVYWDLDTHQQQTMTMQLDINNCKSAVMQAEEFLLKAAEIDFDPQYRHPNNKLSTGNEFKKIPLEQIHDYILALAEYVGRRAITGQENAATLRFGEHATIRRLLDIAMDLPILQTQLLFMSTLALAMQENSSAIKIPKNQILFWLKSHAEMPGHLQALAEKLCEQFQQYCGLN